MDWINVLLIIGGIFGVTGIISMLIPKDRDPEIGSTNDDGTVIPTPGLDGSVMGAGGDDEDYEVGGDDGDGDGDPTTLVN